jgi:hypothetical protein
MLGTKVDGRRQAANEHVNACVDMSIGTARRGAVPEKQRKARFLRWHEKC